MPCAADSLDRSDLARLASVRIAALPLPASLAQALATAEVGDLSALAMRESAEIAALCAGSPKTIAVLTRAIRHCLAADA